MRVERTSEEKILGGLTHLAIFFSWFGLIVNVVLYVIYRSKSAYVTGHVKQSIALQALAMVVNYIVGFIFGFGMLGGIGLGSSYAFGAALGIGSLLVLAVAVISIVLAIIAAVKGFQGQEHRHPIMGDWVAKLGE
jgi:uncharacterized Tic20 family protein